MSIVINDKKMIAVLKVGGKQYIVQEKDKVRVEQFSKKEGSQIIINDVLLMSDKSGQDIKIGKPKVSNAKVLGKIVKNSRANKITVIKYKPKTRYRRELGHRQPYTLLEIEKITTV